MYLESLQQQIKDRRPLAEKLQAYRQRQPAAVDIEQVLAVDNHHKTADEILNFEGNIGGGAQFLQQIPADEDSDEANEEGLN